MWYQANVTAYDMIDHVQVSATVIGRDDLGQAIERQVQTSTTFPGTGEQDARQWLKDALVALIEVT